MILGKIGVQQSQSDSNMICTDRDVQYDIFMGTYL